jgi:hypothetical protein
MIIHLRVALLAALALCMAGFGMTLSLARAGALQSGCSSVRIDSGPPLTSCHRGLLGSYPNLMSRGCTAVGVTARAQLWSCPRT